MPERVLIIINTIDCGGAETFVMKVFRSLDTKRFVFDFLINKKDSDFYLKEIQSLGGRVYYGVSKSVNPFKSFSFITNTVRENHYKNVFCISVHPLGFLDLLAAKMGGAKRLLIRSTTSQHGGRLTHLLAAMARPFVRMVADAMFAPSEGAGSWLFGKKAVESGKVNIINNGVDLEQYVYNESLRQQIRASLNIAPNQFVIGHVGRFNPEKNHKKLINVFCSIKKKNADAVLMLVGDGRLRSNIEEQIVSLGLSDSVLFLGMRTDVPSLLSAFDALVFPSIYEGMPNVVIEAQATDLPSFISDSITRKVKITERVVFLPITESDVFWAKQVLDSKNTERGDRSESIKSAGFDIHSTTGALCGFFIE